MRRGWVAIRGATASAVALLVAGCGSGLPTLVQPTPSGAVAEQCVAVMAALPPSVMGQDQRAVTGNIATWGDPRISLRCGVDQPRELDRTSPCDELNGIGWFTQEPGTALAKAWRFTTIGRAGFIEVIVPEGLEPAGDALMDLSQAVALLPVVTPCA